MLKNLRITAKLGLGFGLVLLLFGVAVFFSWQSISGVQNELTFLTKVVQAVGSTSTMTDTIAWVRAGIRDLRYSESEDDISTLQGYISDLRPKVDALKRLYAEVPRIDILAQSSNVETALRSTTTNLDKVISMIRTKKAAAKKLDEGIAQMQELLSDIVDTQYKRTYATTKDVALGNIEQGKIESELNRKVERLRVIEGAAASLLHAAWQYQQGMQYRDVKTLNEVVEALNKLQTVCENFSATTRDPEISEKLKSARGAFLTFKDAFADVLRSYNETDPLFLSLLKDGRQMVDIANKILDTCLGHLNRLMNNASNNLGSSVLLLIALAIAAIIIGLFIATYLAGSIRKPLGRVVELVTNARDGDVSIVRDDFHYEGHDELGDLGDALSEMFVSLRTAISEIRDNANSSTDKASTMHEDAAANVEGANSVRKAVADTVKLMETNSSTEKAATMHEDAAANLAGANDVRQAVANAVKLMESNSASLEQSNAGTEEMSAASMTSAQAATDCAEFIANVTQVANTSTQTVQEAIANMA
ncbi:MAG: methyl-accepting chemotaxis protein, partial [Synergistaceae bacterium]|nr:methyl-accepting chemotaxis protein [Synergistaceae bacterium]